MVKKVANRLRFVTKFSNAVFFETV